MNVLSNVELVSLDIRKWSGLKKLTEKDLGITPGTLPPEELASLGSIRLIDNDALDIFEALKKRARRAATTVGTRFIAGCWAVPNDRVSDLVKVLMEIESEYTAAIGTLLSGYDASLDAQCAKFPQWSHLIREKSPEPAVIEQALAFRFQTFKVAEGSLPDTLTKEVDGLAGTLVREIEVEARNIWESSFEGKTEVTQRALNPMRVLLDKLRSFAWLNPSVKGMSQALEAILVAAPSTGKVSGADFDAVNTGLLLMMSGRLVQHANGLAAATPSPQVAPQPTQSTPVTTPKPSTPSPGAVKPTPVHEVFL